MNLVTLPLATPAQLPPYVASRTLMAFAGFFSSAVLATGEQRIMKATHPSARPRCIQSSENLEASCSLSLVWSCRSALKKSSSQPDMLQLRSMTARDFSLTRFSCLRLSQAIRDSPEMWLGIFLNPDARCKKRSERELLKRLKP